MDNIIFMTASNTWGKIIGYEDFSKEPIEHKLDKPMHSDWRYIVDTGDSILYVFQHDTYLNIEAI